MSARRRSLPTYLTRLHSQLGLCLPLLLVLFTHAVSGAEFLGFNQGPFYIVVNSIISPTVPMALEVTFDAPVPVDTFVFITTSDPTSLIVVNGGVTVPAGQTKGTVLLTALSLAANVTLTGAVDSTQFTANVSVVSQIPSYTLTLNTNGNGSILSSPPGTNFPAATVVSLTATPASNYTFIGWSVGATGTVNPLSVTMSNDTAITANFAFTSSNVFASIAFVAQISWFAATNVNYQVQGANLLNSNSWVDLGPLVAGNNQTNYYHEVIGSNQSRFYRVMARP